MRVLRKREAAARVGVSSRTLERWSSDPRFAGLGFPRLVRVGPNTSGFLEAEIDDWLAKRAGLRDGAASGAA